MRGTDEGRLEPLPIPLQILGSHHRSRLSRCAKSPIAYPRNAGQTVLTSPAVWLRWPLFNKSARRGEKTRVSGDGFTCIARAPDGRTPIRVKRGQQGERSAAGDAGGMAAATEGGREGCGRNRNEQVRFDGRVLAFLIFMAGDYF